MIYRAALIALLFAISFAGCSTTKPVVWVARDVSFEDFTSFEIPPVFNVKSLPVNQDILALLTVYLMEEFGSKKLQLNHDPRIKKGILIVQSDLMAYELNKVLVTQQGGSRVNREASCTLSTRLIDKATNRVVGKIITVKRIGVGIPGSAQEWILRESAVAVAREVIRITQSNEPG